MNNRINYQKLLEQVLDDESNRGKRLLLHSCCAPCSSYVLVYLSKYFEITIFYFNPNITDQQEYQKRVEEQKRLIYMLNEKEDVIYPIHFIEGKYSPEEFFHMAKGLEKEPEGGKRCMRCYELRLKEAAMIAAEEHFDFWTTTLTISPLKNAQALNELGEKYQEIDHVPYLFSDFKKKNGYLTSIALSKEYDLYRQDYCGCIYSKLERENHSKNDAIETKKDRNEVTS